MEDQGTGASGVEHEVLQPQTVIATFNPSTGWVGKHVLYFDGVFTLEGVGELAPQQVLQYDSHGQIDWAYDGLREWVAGLPATAPQPVSRVRHPGDRIYEYTPWWARLIATWLDMLVMFVPTAAIGAVFTATMSENDAGNAIGAFYWLGLFAYFVVMESWKGKTLGKMAFKAQVLTLGEQRISVWRSLVRNFFKMLGLGGSLITLLCIVLSKRSQRVGDMLAGTIVVRDVTATAKMPDLS